MTPAVHAEPGLPIAAQYWLAVAVVVILGALGCIAVRRSPQRYATVVGR